MLVLVTMFVNINTSLPKTSYMKMVELWLIVTLIIPYVETLIFTYQVIPGKFIHLYYSGWVSSGFLPCKIPPKGFLPWDSSHQDSSHTGFLPRDSSPMGFLPYGIPPTRDSSHTGFLLQDSSNLGFLPQDSSHTEFLPRNTE